MTEGTTLTDAKEACALNIDRLAEDDRFESRQEDLYSLAAALRDQADGSWTGVDLVGAFPADATISVQPTPPWERLAGILAGAAVFLPVAWTWYSLNKAINAYHKYLASTELNPDVRAGETFLSLWTTGFDGYLSSSLHHFGQTALVSVGLILFALVLIVAHRMLADRNVTREDTFMHGAYKELVIELLRAQRLLNERRTDDPRFLEEAIKRSVAELLEAQESTIRVVEGLSDAAAQALDDLRKATTQSVTAIGDSSASVLEKLNGATQKTVGDLNGAVASVGDQLKPMMENANKVGQALVSATGTVAQAQGAVQTSADQLASNASSIAAELQKTVGATQAGLESSTSQMQAKLTQILEEFSLQLNTSNAEMVRQTGAALGSLAGSVEKVAAAKDEWSRSLADGLAGSAQSVTGVENRVQQFVNLLQAHQGTLQAQVDAVTRVIDQSDQLLSEVQNHTQNRLGGR